MSLELLKSNLSKLSASDAKFASSMIAQHEKKGKLSPAQWSWVAKLNERAANPKPAAEKVQIGNMAGIMNLFHTAAKHLKSPAINLQTPEGLPVHIYVAGPKSKTPGYVQITDGSGWGGVWYGRVSPTGEWEKSARENAQKGMASVQALLVCLSANPAATAAEYGQLTGRCCFCNHKLTAGESTEVGYGPDCADHYGLPWGKKTPFKAQTKAIPAPTPVETPAVKSPASFWAA